MIDIETKELLVRYHDDDPDLPDGYKPSEHPLEFNGKGDWIDLYTARRHRLGKGWFKLINLGVSIKVPEGYEIILAPRSSTFKNYGLLQANSIGIIDESYCGDDDVLYFPAYSTRDVIIEPGIRLCQFRIIKHQPEFRIKTVEHLDNINRGSFGSTGR